MEWIAKVFWTKIISGFDSLISMVKCISYSNMGFKPYHVGLKLHIF